MQLLQFDVAQNLFMIFASYRLNLETISYW